MRLPRNIKAKLNRRAKEKRIAKAKRAAKKQAATIKENTMKHYDLQVIRGYAYEKQMQTVELTFQQGGNTVKMTEKVGGNCTGLDVIDCAISNAAACWPHMNEDGDAYFPLGKDLGDRYEDGDWIDNDDLENVLKRRLVSAKIVKVEYEPEEPK
jgi:hypothetical protein